MSALDPTGAQQSVRVGGVVVDRETLLGAARSYLVQRGRFGYPAYDSFNSAGGPWRVSDGDFLAPVLLNAEVNSRAFYSLESIRPQLESWLRSVPMDTRLVEAGPAELEKLADLFAVLDGEDLPNARGSILAKVMHRKRPAFIPLYDPYVDYCYRGCADAPISKDSKRPWKQFMPLLGAAMIEDLTREKDLLAEVVAMAESPVISPLRALDIVAWHAGRIDNGPAIWAASTDESADHAAEDGSDSQLVQLSEEDEAP